ncbi:MAG: hypothetical protein RL238_3775 [Actinomycetota bacterium]|jgi:hypothetical protein
MSHIPSDGTSPTRPDRDVPVPDLAAIEAIVRRAIDERRPDLLTVVGNGELTIALRWEHDGVDLVVKRMPPFPHRAAADEYIALVRRHVDDLARHGVRCVTTDLHSLTRADGTVVVYHCQPLLTVELLADQVLRCDDVSAEHPIVTAVVDHVVRAVRGGVPVDAQFANWYWFDGEVWQLDLSTPLYVDGRGDICFDSTGFQREYPAALRRIVYKELMKVAPNYSDVEWVLTDTMTQLHRQGLERWCVAVTEAAAQRHDITLDPALGKSRYDADAKFFPTLLKMKRFQRAWVQRTGRRYDTLLPATTSFGR